MAAFDQPIDAPPVDDGNTEPLLKRGSVDRDVTIMLPGGELGIRWPDDDAQVIMSGPAAFVFEGEWAQ